VSEDATLDAFAEPESESTDETTPSDDVGTPSDDVGTPSDGAGAAESADAPDDGIPVTSSWTATASCPDCGESVTRLWQDGDASVCTACKTWRASSESPCDR
jgi:hypothetical protein